MLDQESLKYIFGIKLKALRKERAYSLKKLSQETGLSPSYLNEIEKGKKYPKSEKIMLLSQKLGIEYDELISVKLKNQYQSLTKIFENQWLKDLPLEVFGIPADKVVEIVAEQPERTSALFGTLLDIARIHNISSKDFYYAALRSYIDRHKNYFEDLENAATDYRTQFSELEMDLKIETLKSLLHREFGKKVEIQDFAHLSEDLQPMEYFRKNRTLYINGALQESQKIFILARELGYMVLNLTPTANPEIHDLKSYSDLHNKFQASYFAGAFCLPEEKMVDQLEEFMSKRNWSETLLARMQKSLNMPMLTIAHRILQVLPRHFGIEKAYLLKFSSDEKNSYEIKKDLQLSAIFAPSRAVSYETYCRRWLSIQCIEQLRSKSQGPVVGVQKSQYLGTQNQYLNFSFAQKNILQPSRLECVTFGIMMDENLEKRFRFSQDRSIRGTTVAGTCERCSIEECESRAKSAKVYLNNERKKRAESFIQQL